MAPVPAAFVFADQPGHGLPCVVEGSRDRAPELSGRHRGRGRNPASGSAAHGSLQGAGHMGRPPNRRGNAGLTPPPRPPQQHDRDRKPEGEGDPGKVACGRGQRVERLAREFDLVRQRERQHPPVPQRFDLLPAPAQSRAGGGLEDPRPSLGRCRIEDAPVSLNMSEDPRVGVAVAHDVPAVAVRLTSGVARLEPRRNAHRAQEQHHAGGEELAVPLTRTEQEPPDRVLAHQGVHAQRMR
jgi:hypothetical protein